MSQTATQRQAARSEAVANPDTVITKFRKFVRRRPTLAFLLCSPLLALVLGLIVYPFFYSIWLSLLNKKETAFVGLANYFFLFKRDTFWMVVRQSVLFTLTAVFFKALIGFIMAHLIDAVPSHRQRIWRGLALIPWVMPPALSTLGWWWIFDPSHSAFNWILQTLFGTSVPWLSHTGWARFCVILVNVWFGTPFFLIMYLAALKSVPANLYEAAAIDGANAWQRLIYVTIPMLRNIIAITMLFSTIVTFANFDIVRVLTMGGPRNTTHLFGTYSFSLGIMLKDIPLGACVSLFMFPVLAVAAFFILRNVRQRVRES
jgi:multiple sugar transport system permease protein